jgi:uncharacterized protein YceK
MRGQGPGLRAQRISVKACRPRAVGRALKERRWVTAISKSLDRPVCVAIVPASVNEAEDMWSRLFWAMMAGVALFGSGCGTLRNLGSDGTQDVYGGLQDNYKCINESANPATRRNLILPEVGIALCVFDMPLSLIGDTLTLPYTVGVQVNRSISDYYFPKPPTILNRPAQEGELSTPGNALARFAGNKFEIGNAPSRIGMPFAASAPAAQNP